MFIIIALFIQIILLGFQILIPQSTTKIFYILLVLLLLECFISKPMTQKTKWICSKSMLQILKNCLLTNLILNHIENTYLYWIVFLGGIFMITKNFTNVLIIKKIDYVIENDRFIRIYTKIFSFYRNLRISSQVFLVALFLQLEVHTINIQDHWKIYSFFFANFGFIPYFLLIIMNIIESIIYIKWSVKGDIQINNNKKVKQQ